jgi:hypothetical protein
MKVWKSPVLYLGLLLVAAVLTALIAPLVVDWNAYRADLENYGRKLTGRAVTIEGPISARLFPWPRLTVADVHLANLPGLAEKDFASAGSIVVNMQLAGLFSGTIQVESIDIGQPVLAFERTAAGQGNWQFSPAAEVSGNELLGRVKLDQIRLRDGVVRLIDRRREGSVELSNVDAELAAPGIGGPWNMRRGSVSYHERPFEISIATGTYRPGEPFRFGLRAAPGDGSGLAYSFDGASDGGHARGIVRVEPAAGTEGKTDAEGKLRPLVLTAKADASFDDVVFDDISVTPQDTTQGGTLMSGSARVTLGRRIEASAALDASRIDLDEFTGAKANALLREGQGLSLVNSAVGLIPPDVSIGGTLKIASLRAGGEDLDNVAISLSGDREALHVDRFYAGLPGRSEVLFEKGLFLPGKTGAELAGSLAVEANDLRALTGWLWPEGKDGLARVWTGSRGRLKLQTDVSVKPERLRFSGAKYELDGVPGTVDLAIAATATGRPTVDLRIDTGNLDIDNFASGGTAALPAAQGARLADALSFLLPSQSVANLRLTVQAEKLLLNGVEADDIAIDLAAGANGLDLRTVQIGSVGGARLDASGLILDSGNGNDGAIDVTVAAEDPRGLLRLAGLMPGDAAPAWTEVLGKTALDGMLTVKAGKDSPLAEFRVMGTSGDLAITASGGLSGGPALDAIDVKGALELRAPNGETLTRLAGFVPVGSDQSAGRLVLTGSGSPAKGFLADLVVQAFGANFQFNGGRGSDGRLDGKTTLRATNALPLLAALGVPSAALPSGVLVLDGSIGSDAAHPLTLDFSGRMGEQPLKGSVTADPAGKLMANVETGPLSLADVLAASLLVWNGQALRADTAFAAGLPFGLSGEAWITPARLRINDNFEARGVQLVLASSPAETHLELAGKDDAGRDARIRLTSRPEGDDGSRAIEGKIALPVDLGQQLRLASGAAVAAGTGTIEITFAGKGRSPGGALAALAGSGSYRIAGLRLLDINPLAFKAVLGPANDAQSISKAFAALGQGGGLDFGNVDGSVAIEHGVATFSSFAVRTADAEATVKTVADLGQGALDAAVSLTILDSVPRPPMEISFVGPPAGLVRNEDKAELFGQLGVAMMNRGVAELERLRLEQERLAAEEQKARAEDEAKLQDYYAQRDELRLRQRELKVHAALRVRAAEALRQQLEASRAANAEINKAELKQRLRELRVYRRLARAAQVPAEPAPQPKPRPRTAVPRSIPDILLLPPSQQGESPVSPTQ